MISPSKIDNDLRKTLAHWIDLKPVLEKAYEIPPLPASAVRLAALVASHNYRVDDVVEIISYDPALTIRLIRTANSVVSGGATPVTTAKDAALRLGSANILTLAVASRARRLMKVAVPEYQMDEGQLWNHSVATALVAELLPKYCKNAIPPETFTAALLHDIGKLVMARFLDPETSAWLNRARQEGGVNALDAEREVLHIHHGELGGIIAHHWKMPEAIVNGIIHHHSPEEGGDIVSHAVSLSNEAAKVVEEQIRGNVREFDITESTLDQTGMTLETLENLCKNATQEFAELSRRFSV